MTNLLKSEGVVPDVVAGLSLGEYSALYVAEVFDAKTAIELVCLPRKSYGRGSTRLQFIYDGSARA